MAPGTDGDALDAESTAQLASDSGPPTAPLEPDTPPVWAVGRRVVASSEHHGGVVARLSDAPGSGAGTGGGEPGPGEDAGGEDVEGLETGAETVPGWRPELTGESVEEVTVPGWQPEAAGPVGESVEDDVAADWQPELARPAREAVEVDEVAADWQPESAGEAVEVDEVAADWQPESEPDTAPEPEPEPGDAGSLRHDYEALLAAAESVLDQVDRALARLDDGTYGTCEACGRPIADDLLAADPTATACEQHLRPVEAHPTTDRFRRPYAGPAGEPAEPGHPTGETR